MILLLVAALLVMGVVYGTNMNTIDKQTVPCLDLERYMGEWYEIARYDHSFERGLVDVQAVYKLKENGRIEVVNSGTDLRSGKRKIARGRAYASRVAGRLRVSFFLFFYSDYNVLEVGEQYGWALVGSRSSKYLWILSRTPVLPARTLSHIIQLAEERGYKSDRLLFVDQGS